MSKEAYEAVLPEAQALPKEKIKNPYMPLDTFFQEAENIYPWAMKDKETLMKAGLAESVFERLQLLADASRFAQSTWVTELQSKKDAEKEWSIEAPKAFDLQGQLMHTFNYAYSKHEEAKQIASAIAEGAGNADMIQDLSDSAVLARKYPEPLEAINFDFNLVDMAETTSAKMADLLALANGDRMEESETLTIRNQMYTLLKEVVDEIRNCGKYVFWRDKDRLIGYTSKYNRDSNRKRS